MKILLISPPLHSLYHAVSSSIPPLGLLYMAGRLEADGHDIEVSDMTYYDGYDLVGITCTTPQLPRSIDVRSGRPRVGLQDADRRNARDLHHATTLKLPHVNFVVRGEGEQATSILCKALDEEGSRFARKISSLSWYDQDTGVVVDNPQIPDIATVDDLPRPARHLVDMDAYKVTKLGPRPVTTMITSRGCPYN